MKKDILILNSRLVTYDFKDDKGTVVRSMTFNRVTFAFRDDLADKEVYGLDTILSCNLDPSTIDITKSIKPNEIVSAVLGLKRVEEGKYKYIISKIKDVEV